MTKDAEGMRPMTDHDQLGEQFQEHREHLRGVAYRMLGSLGEADDAVQEAWLRFSRSDTSSVENLGGWLTTIVARVCLDMLRARKSRREEPASALVPDPVVSLEAGGNPEHEALMADSVGLALLVVLETLPPAERLAFVLHDVFAVSFDEIAPIVDRSPIAARQLASRARRRIRGASVSPDADLSRQRQVVNAFLAASRAGDFEALLAVLDPDVVFRLDRGAAHDASKVVRGAAAVAGLGFSFSGEGWAPYPAVVNGAAGIVMAYRGHAASVIGFTIRDGRIATIDILADGARIRRLDLPVLGE
jgi:RNA polymerase sigma-70 factor (ECF subfamily)